MNKQHVHIIKTGGTIEFHDPAYEEMNSKLMKFDASIESYLNNLINPLFDFSTVNLFQKDSREITDQDRERLLQEINSSTHEHYHNPWHFHYDYYG